MATTHLGYPAPNWCWADVGVLEYKRPIFPGSWLRQLGYSQFQ